MSNLVSRLRACTAPSPLEAEVAAFERARSLLVDDLELIWTPALARHAVGRAAGELIGALYRSLERTAAAYAASAETTTVADWAGVARGRAAAYASAARLLLDELSPDQLTVAEDGE